MSTTKIVATIGPATNTKSKLRALHRSGMRIARLNGSHNNFEWHSKTIELIRQTLPELPIIFDIPGRKVRTTDLKHEPSFLVGDLITLTTDKKNDGKKKIPVNYANLHKDAKVGTTILADDGTLKFTVIKINGRDIICQAQTSGQLKSRKGINLPLLNLNTKLITERDRKMVGFAIDSGVDFIGISFVESAKHVRAIQKLTKNNCPRIVAKIENLPGLKHMREIITAADAVMIDRGDLSVETNLESLAISQKKILKVALENKKPVIVATEMLHTMIENSFPTKAEVSDISNAILDGAAATMLSGETAIGKHAIESVNVMKKVSDATINHMHQLLDEQKPVIGDSIPQVMGQASALICRSLPITKIIAVTISGFAARAIALSRPRQPILAISNDVMAARSFNILPGTVGVYVNMPFSKVSTDHIPACLNILWERKLISRNDMLLVTAVAYPRSGNRMNLIQTHVVNDLAEIMGWSQ